MATRIGILGSNGRMGRAIAAVVTALDPAVAIVAGGVDSGDDPHALAAGCDVLVDFSSSDAVVVHLQAACAAGTPLLIGTTGLDPAHHAAIDAAATQVAVLQQANTALGVNLLAALVRQAAARLGEDWDIEVVEMHHRDKVDAPSGTALLLAQAAAQGRGHALPELARFDRFDTREPRQPGTIGFASLRGGSVVGDHMVVLAGPGERIELGHRADSRAIFARGAVRAAQWLAGRAPGRYTMDDVLGL